MCSLTRCRLLNLQSCSLTHNSRPPSSCVVRHLFCWAQKSLLAKFEHPDLSLESGVNQTLERFCRMFRSDRLEAVAHRAPDCRLVVALTPQVHGPGDMAFFFHVVPRRVADVFSIGIKFGSRQTGWGRCDESRPLAPPTGSGTAPP